MHPGPKLWVRSSSFAHPQDSLHKLLASHVSNQALHLLLPGCSAQMVEELPEHARLVDSVKAYYYEVQMNLSSLTDRNFIDQMKQPEARVHAITADADLDRDVAAVTPGGWLHLSVGRSTYRQLGLDGSYSSVTGK
jgi:Ribonuclease P 40kDa (Rpp40) subunit